MGDYRVLSDAGWMNGQGQNDVLQVVFAPASIGLAEVAVDDGLSQEARLPPSVIPESGSISDGEPAVVQGADERRAVVALSVDDYLPPSRLDRIPKPLGSVDTRIDMRGMFGVVGEAEIMLLISSEGHVDDVLVLGASLPDFIVDEAVKRFRGVAFDPGRVGERAVRSRLRIRFSPPSQDELLGNPHSAREKAWR